MSLEWIITGMVLLGAMIAGGFNLWIKKRKESQLTYSFETKSDLDEKDNEERLCSEKSSVLTTSPIK